MLRSFAIAGISAVAVLSGPAAEAGETTGEITGVIEGEARTWYVTIQTVGGETMSQSDWENFPGIGYSVSLTGHDQPGGIGTNGAINVSFMVSAANAVSEPAITYFYQGFGNVYDSGQDGAAEVVVDSVSVDGDIMTVEGGFAGSLGHFSLSKAEPMDGKTSLTVTDGRFRAEVMILK